MKPKFLLIISILMIVWIVSQESYSQTISITDVSWLNQVDNDGDTYTRSRTMKINYTSNVNLIAGLSVEYRINNGGIMYSYIETSCYLNAGSSYLLVDGFGSPTWGEFSYNIYDFIVRIMDWPGFTTVYATRSYSSDSDLNDEKFETAAEDVQQPADLIVTNPNKNPDVVQAGSTLYVVCDVVNQGLGSTTVSSTLGYYLSTDYTYSSNDIPLGTDNVGILGPGEISSENETLTIPSNTQAGFYYIIFYADCETDVWESNENNNTNWASFTVTVPTYTVTTSRNPPNGGTTTGDGSYPANSTVTVTASANNCYQFVNWTENGSVVSSSASYTFTITGNRNLVANFSAISYTVTTSSNPSAGGSTTGGGSYACNSSVTVTATPSSCYQFVNWTENGNVVSSNASYTFTITSNRNLVANFSVISYTVTTSSNPSAGGTTTGGGSYSCNSSVTVTATPSSCYQFVNWTENGNVVSSNASYTFTINSNRNLVANFSVISYTITTSSNPSAGGSTTGGGSYACNSSGTVTATPYSCYQFINWTENGNVVSSNASYTFTINTNRNLVANFSIINYFVTTLSNPTDGGTTTGGGNHEC